MSTSQIFTIGTALRRAEDNGVPVEVLVEGQWLRGEIAGLDGDGLVLVTPERTQCVVRNAHISVVRILANLSFDDEAPSEPQATSYESTSNGYDAPPAWEPAAATSSTASPTYAPSEAPAGEDTSPFRWASTDRPAAGPVVADVDDDHLVLDADDLLVLDGGDDGPLELGSGGSWEGDEPATEPVTVTPDVVAAEPEEAPEVAAESPEAEVIELRPEPVATDEVAETTAEQAQPVVEPLTAPVRGAKETSDDLVSRLLAESMREAGIEPEQPATAEAAPEPAAEAAPEETAVETAAEAPAAAETDLLHPEKTVDDDEPRIFALPAPSSAAAPAAGPESAPVAVTPPAAPAATPAPEPVPAAEPAAATAPAAQPDVSAPPAVPGDDWRSMLEGLRSEATAPQSGQTPPNGQGEEKRRGRRLVMR